MKTWHIELAVVAAVLSAVALLSGGSLVEWIGTLAVLASFAHGQVSDRLAEREAARERPAVHCHRMSGRYFIAKEALWLSYFVTHRAWSALAGVLLFLLYPAWRRFWRTRHPLAAAP